MKVLRWIRVNNEEVPVLISDEKEALLAAKAAGRAIIGLWHPKQSMDELAGARYVVEEIGDVTDEFAERVARRNRKLPWKICETERLMIREISAEDFEEIIVQQVGYGLGSIEELKSYTQNQYEFYEFGFWAVLEKKSGALVGVAGLTVLEETKDSDKKIETYVLYTETSAPEDESYPLELGYHIFPKFRRQGYAKECCLAILQYGQEELGADKFVVRIEQANHISKKLAEELGFCAVFL